MQRHRLRRDAGFTLVEVCVAMVLLLLAVTGTAELFTVAMRLSASARVQTSTALLASQKLEQLRALSWSVDTNGAPISDSSTDLSFDPPTGGGAGLNPSPADALDTNTPGWVDFLNARGQWVGTGANPPVTARFVRRWAILRLPEDPADTLILHVLVTTVARDRQAHPPRMRLADDALLTTVLSRKAR